MGFIGDLFNSNRGMGYQAQGTNIQQPVNAPDVTAANQMAQGNIAQQQAFVNALGGQGGLANQANVFAQQQALANQLQQQAMGQGPNPVQAQLAQNTGQNIAAQNALMAGQRGAGANAGLIARQAGMQGGALQQQAAGQAATLGAQQQLAAQNALAQQQQAMQGVAGQQIGAQAQGLSGLNQFGQGYQQNLMGGLNAQNQSNVSMQSNINNANAGIAQQNAHNQATGLGGVVNGIASAVALAEGGEIKPGPQSFVGQHLSMVSGGKVPGEAEVKGDSYSNDKVPAVLSPGEVVIPRHVMQSKDPIKGAAEFVRQIQAKKGILRK